MTYSKTFHADNKTDVILQAEAYFVEVIKNIPEHERDEPAIMTHMRDLVNLTRDPGYDEEIAINLSGYIVVQTSGVTSVSSSVSVFIVPASVPLASWTSGDGAQLSAA